jgi:hypothetical protein
MTPGAAMHEERLIHVAHTHLVFEEVDKVVVFHGSAVMVVPFELFCWMMLGNARGSRWS